MSGVLDVFFSYYSFIILSALFTQVVLASSSAVFSYNPEDISERYIHLDSKRSVSTLVGDPVFAETEEVTRNIGLPQLIDLDDLPVSGFTPEQALSLMHQRYRARMLELHGPRMNRNEDLSEKEIGAICGSSASLECGKRVLQYSDYSEHSAPSVSIHLRCNLRKEFLACIDSQRKNCRAEADQGIYPRMPPKSLVRAAQSKIWRSLWTSGGCTLVN